MQLTDIDEVVNEFVGKQLSLMGQQESQPRGRKRVADRGEVIPRSEPESLQLRQDGGQVTLREVQRRRDIDDCVSHAWAGGRDDVSKPAVARSELGDLVHLAYPLHARGDEEEVLKDDPADVIHPAPGAG